MEWWWRREVRRGRLGDKKGKGWMDDGFGLIELQVAVCLQFVSNSQFVS